MEKNDSSEKIKVKPPHIPEEKMKEMIKFFQRTSIPRIITEQKRQSEMKSLEDGKTD